MGRHLQHEKEVKAWTGFPARVIEKDGAFQIQHKGKAVVTCEKKSFYEQRPVIEREFRALRYQGRRYTDIMLRRTLSEQLEAARKE